VTQHLGDFKPHRPLPALRRDWQALILAAKENAERWLRYQRALEEDSEETAPRSRRAMSPAFWPGRSRA